jgi:ubiquinol-cytochrome c reductase cytochrome b subunit
VALFFDPSMTEITYKGVYQPLRGVQMSRAYDLPLRLRTD